ncbi:contractile injection system tape measure protein [Photorhabdus namnaonensis]|uniref:Uncharacterized protein n=1 Tax=Photorhabdus namnaonensis TaxID=1851568 RepID=A0A1B8YGK5_9GAMM|nr:contractile injection system tape measure protein [Photorhabdus namnaonensis]OCA54284.1 hypothetical protein Phpb_02728 [Photorhabdus namnaonensis]
MLNRIIITIESNHKEVAESILHGSLINQHKISNLLNSFFNKDIINKNLHLERLILNLGEINFHEFNSLLPIRLNAALKQALSQYQLSNNNKLHQKKPTLQKINNKPKISSNNYLINSKEFICYLYRKDTSLSPIEEIKYTKLPDTNINLLINQLTQIDNKWVLLLVKSCLSEHSLLRLLAIGQSTLLNAISLRLSEKANISLYQEELVSPGQLILNALEYMKRHNIEEIPKPDAKIISRITAELNNGTLNSSSIINLFRQIKTQKPLLNEWLEPLWQIEAISQLCKKHLSVQEYKNLVNRFNHKNQLLSKQPLQQTVSVDSMFTEILHTLATGHKQILPQLNQHQLSLIATAIQQGDVKTQNILRLFQHPELYHSAGTAWLAQLWQLAPVSQRCKKQLSTDEYQYLSQRFVPNHTLITKDQQTLSTLDNLCVTGNNHNQFRTSNRPCSEAVLLPEHPLTRQVSNAGILVLWPILPALFNQLGLFEEQKFIDRQAQFSAVDCLDYLIWGTKEEQSERKVLNNVLCGLIADEITESVPLEPEKQLIATQWLDEAINQLPAWKKLSRNDARQLFLQRPGELLINELEIKITVQHQPFDVLLADWPWPLNIARLPWMNRSLLVDWKNI